MATILFADDDAEIRIVMTLMLERVGGHRAIVARNGQEAIELAERWQPDLILLDLNMPIVDGWTATQHIKAQPHLATIPILAVTAHGSGAEGNRARQAGCSEVITKPVDMATLLLQIASYLPPAC